MKQTLLAIGFMFFISCTHSHSSGYRATGIIKGQDLGACMCCGGYVIEVTGNDSSYRFPYFPASTSFDTTSFPISVQFSYTENYTCGSNHFITIQSMAKID